MLPLPKDSPPEMLQKQIEGGEMECKIKAAHIQAVQSKADAECYWIYCLGVTLRVDPSSAGADLRTAIQLEAKARIEMLTLDLYRSRAMVEIKKAELEARQSRIQAGDTLIQM